MDTLITLHKNAVLDYLKYHSPSMTKNIYLLEPITYDNSEEQLYTNHIPEYRNLVLQKLQNESHDQDREFAGIFRKDEIIMTNKGDEHGVSQNSEYSNEPNQFHTHPCTGVNGETFEVDLYGPPSALCLLVISIQIDTTRTKLSDT